MARACGFCLPFGIHACGICARAGDFRYKDRVEDEWSCVACSREEYESCMNASVQGKATIAPMAASEPFTFALVGLTLSEMVNTARPRAAKTRLSGIPMIGALLMKCGIEIVAMVIVP